MMSMPLNRISKATACVATALLMGACASSSPRPPEQQGLPKNAPDWVARGSVVREGSVFGVGMVAGIKNVGTARTTAANRARKEIQKIMETYSASLMKDYSASTTAGDFSSSSEEQRVEEAVKTFSAGLQKGVEIVNNWVDANGTYYSLAELNFERAKLVASFPGDSKVGDWLDKNGGRVLEDMESKSPPPPPPPAASAPPPPPPSSPSATPEPPPVAPPVLTRGDDGPAPREGARPKWRDGGCDNNTYLCGVGDGAKKKAADIDARAELARIFKSSVASVSQSFDSAARTINSKTGESWFEVNAIAEYSVVSTDKMVTMSEIVGRWIDDDGRYWSLAVIDRRQAGNALRAQIQQLDGVVGQNLGKARETSDKVARLKSLKRAVRAHVQREALNTDLRVIDKSGRGIPSPYAIADLLDLLDDAARELRLGIALSGAGASRVQACLEEALTDKGYQIAFNTDEDSDDELDVDGSFDVLIKGRVRNEKRGKVMGANVVQTTLTLKLINAKSGKVVRTITGSQKGTRRSVRAAASTSAFKVCQRKVPSMVRDIDRYFGK